MVSTSHPAAGGSARQNTSSGLTQAPLIALLGHAHDALEAAFNDRMRSSEFADLTMALSRNVLRHLSADECRASQLALASGVSKQALSLQIDKLERSGYVRSEADPTDRRAKRVVLTDKGVRAQELVRDLMGQIDADWRSHWRESTWRELREHLIEVIESRVETSTCDEPTTC